MQLYTVYENGVLRKVDRINFSENRAFLIDDIKTIYLWFGSGISDKKKDFADKKANVLNARRKGTAKIQVIKQGKEFGAFLAMMDVLEKGLEKGLPIERRPELELDIGETMELIEAGLDPDFEAKVSIAAYNLSQEKKSYKELCRTLAEIQLKLMKGNKKLTETEINKKSNDIFKSSSTYEELCWLIAELSMMSKKKL
ncbi:MAG: hypothetical protein ACFE9T_03120 [Promethearchaeota archaeon]